MGAGKKHSSFSRAYRHRLKTRGCAHGRKHLKTSCNRAARRHVHEILEEVCEDVEVSEEAVWENVPYASNYDVI